MATVATTSHGHGLSVLTNACVKQPPKTQYGGASANYGTGKGGFIAVKSVNFDGGDVKEMTAPVDMTRRWVTDSGLDESPTIEVGEDLGALSNDEFYVRLMQLKKEHKKTLELCEKLYRQKIATETNHSEEFDRCEEGGVVNERVQDAGDLAGSQEWYTSDVVPRDLTSKPPLATKNKLKTRPSSAPVRRKNLSRSLDEDEWHMARLSTGHQHHIQGDNGETLSEIYNMEESSSASISRIEDMWEQFSVDDYAPRGRTIKKRPSSAHSEELHRDARSDKGWRHRITIPQPFQMTLRESSKEKIKSKTQLLHEQELLEKKQQEEAECQKKFKASPVPAHVYLPLFEEYNEKKEARRRYVRHYRKELLKSLEQPFKFMAREENKKQRLLMSAPPVIKSVNVKTFKAKPVPDYLYDNSVNEKVLEEEEYRKIRIKMRAEEMMRSASLPPNMEARKKLKEEKIKQQKSKSRSGRRRFVPRINGDVPDYDELYQQFQKELQRRKLEKEGTVMQPFNLRTSKIPSKKEKILKDIAKDEDAMVENRWPFRNPRTTPRKSFAQSVNLSTSWDSIPHRMTSSAEMRYNRGREKAQSISQRERDEIEYYKRQKQKEMKLRPSILERTLASEQESQPRPSREEKLREYRESDKARMAEYRQSLEEIRQRVSQRPLLFEQVKQTNARKAAEKRYSQMLRDHGLDETYVHQKGSLSTGVETNDEEYDFDDTSYKGQDYEITLGQEESVRTVENEVTP